MIIMVMVDECGDEQELERFNLHLDLDEDELELWQERKIRKAREEYPEARSFYFEDRRPGAFYKYDEGNGEALYW